MSRSEKNGKCSFSAHSVAICEALKVLETFAPLVILMDLQLPGLDGLELTRQLKADPQWRDITVLALTAYAMKGDMEKALAAGCDGYMSKPIDPVTLCAVVERHIQAQTLKKNGD